MVATLSLSLAGVLSLPGAAGRLATDGAASRAEQDGARRADEIARALEAEPSGTDAERQQRLVDGFQCFLERMDAFDGARATRVARALHRRADAIWSVFCLEGALRRAAGADVRTDASGRAYAEADAAISRMLSRGGWSRADEIALVQRRAILAAGFADRAGERAALGRALALGGIDGAQISGLTALTERDATSAARLFGSLVDGDHDPEALPWALRGHGLASLEAVRARDL